MDQITDYDSLKAAVAGMVHRGSDSGITANVALFIQLCEAEFYDELILKDFETETTLTLTANQNYVSLPSGYVSPIALWVVVDNERGSPLTPTLPQHLPYSTSASIPREYAIDADKIRFDCPAASGYSAPFRFVKKSSLSGSNTTNYVLLKRPDLYLYGTLKHLAIFSQNEPLLAQVNPLYERAKLAVKAADSRGRSIAPLSTDLPGVVGRSNIFTG